MPRRFIPAIDRIWAWLVPLLVALLVAAASAATPAGTVAQASPRTKVLVVGGLLDLTSGWTSLGRGSRVALSIAAARANARLVSTGSPWRVRVRIVDVRGNPAVALRQLQRLAAQGVRVFIGPESSAEVRAVRAAADSLGVVVVSQGSTAHSLAVPGDNVFRLVPDDRREAEALVALLQRDRVRAIAPIWRDDAGNAGLVQSLRARFGGVMAEGVPYGTDETDFTAEVSTLRQQLSALNARRVGKIGVYLAGFDEVVDVFHAASNIAALNSVSWYGSDGVALTTRLVKDPRAAAFASARGYPNPTLGLDAKAARRSAKLRARIHARLGTQPDAFALTSYDALQIVARAAERSGGAGRIARFKRQLARLAHGYEGVTGRIVLNGAGDRAYGSYDFWSVCRSGSALTWRRTSSYLATAVGRGRIVDRTACRRG